jgi:glutathione S-transferase
MTLQLLAHPFSSYCWKVQIALHENDIPFEYRSVDPGNPKNDEALARLSPLMKFPVLLDGDRAILETSTIIEYLQLHHPGPVRLIPDGDAGIEVRMLDRIFDNYVMGSMQKPVADALRPEGSRDPHGVAEAMAVLDKIYPWLDQRLEGREWAAGSDFTLADCAAAPSLFYADWVREIPAELVNLRAYRARLLARPSVAHSVDEARPFRPYFPLGAPDRD